MRMRQSPSKNEQMDAQATSEGVKECIDCLLATAKECLDPCTPKPWNWKCFSCILTNAPQCLHACGFPAAHASFSGNDSGCWGTCTAQFSNATGACTITEDICGTVPQLQDPTAVTATVPRASSEQDGL